MVKINTKPSYDKLNELYQIALNNNRLLVEKHKKEIAGHVARNRALENEIKKVENKIARIYEDWAEGNF